MSILKIRDENGNVIEIPALKGDDGKSAYEYAREGGYTGTEEEFKAKMAEEIRSIASGGTGATTAEAARTNLGVAPAPIASQTDITAGSTPLATGQDYLVYK